MPSWERGDWFSLLGTVLGCTLVSITCLQQDQCENSIVIDLTIQVSKRLTHTQTILGCWGRGDCRINILSAKISSRNHRQKILVVPCVDVKINCQVIISSLCWATPGVGVDSGSPTVTPLCKGDTSGPVSGSNHDKLGHNPRGQQFYTYFWSTLQDAWPFQSQTAGLCVAIASHLLYSDQGGIENPACVSTSFKALNQELQTVKLKIRASTVAIIRSR